MNESQLIWGILWGAVGLGYFVYGKKQNAIVPLICGLALMTFPWIVESTIPLIAVGVVLMVVPYIVRF